MQWALEHPDATGEELLEALMERIPGPDFPNGALIVGRHGIEDAYRTGRGSVTMRAVVDIEEDRSGRTILVVTELPHMVNPDNLAQKIAELVNTGRLNGIADIRDDTSARTGQRLVIVLKRDASAAGRAEQPVQAHPAAGHVRLQHARPGRRRAADAAARPVHLVLGRPTRSRSSSAGRSTGSTMPRSEAHIYRGLVKALDALDEVIALIRRSRHRRGPRGPEAAARDRRPAGERDPGHAAAPAGRAGAAADHRPSWPSSSGIIADLEDILANRSGSASIVSDELAEIVDKYGDERRTEIIAADGDLSDEDLIPDADVVVTITRGGYAKRTNTDLYRVQKRGGTGVRGAALRADDEVEHLFAHHEPPLDPVLHQHRPGLPGEGLAAARGRPRRQGRARRRAAVVPAGRGDRPGARDPRLRAGALPAAGHPARAGQEDRAGRYDSPRQAGIIAINFRDDDDELIGAELCAPTTTCC